MMRTVAAITAAILIVGIVTVPAMLYLDSLEMQGRFSTVHWPNWVAQLTAFSLIGATIFLAKVLLGVIHRRWPEEIPTGDKKR